MMDNLFCTNYLLINLLFVVVVVVVILGLKNTIGIITNKHVKKKTINEILTKSPM